MAQRRSEMQTYGSLALKPAPEEKRDYQLAAQRYTKRQEAPRTKPVPTRAKRIRAWQVLAVMGAFAAIFGLLYRQITIEQQMIELHEMRTTLTTEQKRAEDLRLELALTHDIAHVQAVARDEMSMNYPTVDQTRQVVLPPVKTPSTAEQVASTVTDEQPEGLSAWLAEMKEKLNL